MVAALYSCSFSHGGSPFKRELPQEKQWKHQAVSDSCSEKNSEVTAFHPPFTLRLGQVCLRLHPSYTSAQHSLLVMGPLGTILAGRGK